MEINYKAVCKLVRDHGAVKVIDATGSTTRIEDDPDSIDLVEKAHKFWFDGVWYSRKDFGKVLDKITK